MTRKGMDTAYIPIEDLGMDIGSLDDDVDMINVSDTGYLGSPREAWGYDYTVEQDTQDDTNQANGANIPQQQTLQQISYPQSDLPQYGSLNDPLDNARSNNPPLVFVADVRFQSFQPHEHIGLESTQSPFPDEGYFPQDYIVPNDEPFQRDGNSDGQSDDNA